MWLLRAGADFISQGFQPTRHDRSMLLLYGANIDVEKPTNAAGIWEETLLDFMYRERFVYM